MHVRQAIASLGTTVSLQDISETAGRVFAVRWKIVTFKSKSKVDFVDLRERHDPTFLLHRIFFLAISVPDQMTFLVVRIANLCEVICQFCGTYNRPVFEVFSFDNTICLVGNAEVILGADVAVAFRLDFSPVPIC